MSEYTPGIVLVAVLGAFGTIVAAVVVSRSARRANAQTVKLAAVAEKGLEHDRSFKRLSADYDRLAGELDDLRGSLAESMRDRAALHRQVDRLERHAGAVDRMHRAAMRYLAALTSWAHSVAPLLPADAPRPPRMPAELRRALDEDTPPSARGT